MHLKLNFHTNFTIHKLVYRQLRNVELDKRLMKLAVDKNTESSAGMMGGW